MSVRSRDALCAPNPLQVHAHTTLQGTLFWVYASLTFSSVLRGTPGARAALRALRAGAAQNFAANAAHVKVEG